MQEKRDVLVVANWKMNPRTLGEAKELFAAVKAGVRSCPPGVVVIAAPYPYLAQFAQKGTGKVSLGAQNVASEKLGALTGEVAVSMLASFGVSYVIVGHSERRARGESDLEIAKKVELVVKANMMAVLCVGERERDQSGKYFGVVEAQVRAALKGLPGSKLPSVVIAYEPVWAISTAPGFTRPATPEDAHEMILFIRKVLSDMYGRSTAGKVRILYGGSVDGKNIGELMERSGAEGFLVGGASLRPSDFITIVKTAYGA